MTIFQLYIATLNTLLVVAGIVIAIYFVRTYNILAISGATNTPAPARELRPVLKGPIQVSVKFREVNQMRDSWITAGYSVLHSRREGDIITLVMTKRKDVR